MSISCVCIHVFNIFFQYSKLIVEKKKKKKCKLNLTLPYLYCQLEPFLQQKYIIQRRGQRTGL